MKFYICVTRSILSSMSSFPTTSKRSDVPRASVWKAVLCDNLHPAFLLNSLGTSFPLPTVPFRLLFIIVVLAITLFAWLTNSLGYVLFYIAYHMQS